MPPFLRKTSSTSARSFDSLISIPIDFILPCTRLPGKILHPLFRASKKTPCILHTVPFRLFFLLKVILKFLFKCFDIVRMGFHNRIRVSGDHQDTHQGFRIKDRRFTIFTNSSTLSTSSNFNGNEIIFSASFLLFGLFFMILNSFFYFLQNRSKAYTISLFCCFF